MTQVAFSERGKVGKHSQINYENDRRNPDSDYLRAIEKAGADILYILTGDRNSSLVDKSRPLAGDVRVGDQEYSAIRTFDIDAAAGNGIVPASEEPSHQVAFSRSWLIQNSIAADLSGLIRVKGDSMAPTIPDGAHILVDFRGKADWSAPGIYVIRHEGAIVVKRLQIIERPDGKLVVLQSDNPLFPPIFVEAKSAIDFQPIARVRAVVNVL